MVKISVHGHGKLNKTTMANPLLAKVMEKRVLEVNPTFDFISHYDPTLTWSEQVDELVKYGISLKQFNDREMPGNWVQCFWCGESIVCKRSTKHFCDNRCRRRYWTRARKIESSGSEQVIS